MNRRAFLRGAVSVMAVAAVLKGRVALADADQLPRGKLEPYRQLTSEDIQDVIWGIYPEGGHPNAAFIPGEFHEWVTDELKAPASPPTDYQQVLEEPVEVFHSEFGQPGPRARGVRLLGQNLRRRLAAYRRVVRSPLGRA